MLEVVHGSYRLNLLYTVFYAYLAHSGGLFSYFSLFLHQIHAISGNTRIFFEKNHVLVPYTIDFSVLHAKLM